MLLYLIYLTWTALASRPTDSCNPFYEEEHGTILQILFGLFFTFIVLVILASSAKDTKGPENKFTNIVAEEGNSEDQIEEDTPNGAKKDSYVFPVSLATMVFQAFMIFVSIYYAMLITNWGRPHVRDDDYEYFISAWAGFWVKIVVSWIMCGLYLFSLLAPLIFPNREF